MTKEKNIDMKRALTLAMLALVCLSGLALAQDVRYNFDSSANFSGYHTYKWVQIPGGVHPNQLVDKQIMDAINTQLSAKGLTMTANDPADLYVGYQISIDQEKQINAYSMGGFGGWGGRMGGMATATTSTINNGTMALDMYDTKTKSLVWRGTATKALDPSGNPEKNQKNLQKAMAKLMKNYPPKQ
jgi:hypothetical protein